MKKNKAPSPVPKGTYLIVMSFDRGRTIPVGRLGPVHFKKGHYVYVGSAFGPGGLKARLNHHLSPKTKQHWHMDYLDLPARQIRVSDHETKLEHEWAQKLSQSAGEIVPGFGCSDCSCPSHLFYFKTLKAWKTALARLSAEYQISCWTTR